MYLDELPVFIIVSRIRREFFPISNPRIRMKFPGINHQVEFLQPISSIRYGLLGRDLPFDHDLFFRGFFCSSLRLRFHNFCAGRILLFRVSGYLFFALLCLRSRILSVLLCLRSRILSVLLRLNGNLFLLFRSGILRLCILFLDLLLSLVRLFHCDFRSGAVCRGILSGKHCAVLRKDKHACKYDSK